MRLVEVLGMSCGDLVELGSRDGDLFKSEYGGLYGSANGVLFRSNDGDLCGLYVDDQLSRPK